MTHACVHCRTAFTFSDLSGHTYTFTCDLLVCPQFHSQSFMTAYSLVFRRLELLLAACMCCMQVIHMPQPGKCSCVIAKEFIHRHGEVTALQSIPLACLPLATALCLCYSQIACLNCRLCLQVMCTCTYFCVADVHKCVQANQLRSCTCFANESSLI